MLFADLWVFFCVLHNHDLNISGITSVFLMKKRVFLKADKNYHVQKYLKYAYKIYTM